MSVEGTNQKELILWKGSYVLFVIAFLLLLISAFVPWHSESLSVTSTDGDRISLDRNYRLFGTDIDMSSGEESGSASTSNIGSINTLQFILLLMGIIISITILLFIFLLYKSGTSDGEEGKGLAISIMILTLIIPILTIILIFLVGGGYGRSSYSESSGNVSSSSSPSIGIFTIFIVFILMIIGVIKWKDIDVKELQRPVTPTQAQSAPIQPQPYIPRNPVILSTPTSNMENELNIILNSNLSRDVKEKRLLKLYLDDKITKEQFYDMKRKL